MSDPYDPNAAPIMFSQYQAPPDIAPWLQQNAPDLDFGDSFSLEYFTDGLNETMTGSDKSLMTTGSADSDPVASEPDYKAPGEGSGLIKSVMNGVGSVSGFMKDNPQLSQSLLAGVAGAFKDKSAQETARMQIDYLKQKQDDMNNSITAYGKTYRKA